MVRMLFDPAYLAVAVFILNFRTVKLWEIKKDHVALLCLIVFYLLVCSYQLRILFIKFRLRLSVVLLS